MLIYVPLKKRLFVLEWKSLQIDYINIGSGSPLERASVLANMRDVGEVLDLGFRNDKFRSGQTIREWILSGPQDQLREYVQSAEIQKWRDDGYTISSALAVVVGSRHVILWNLDGDVLDALPRLALE
jgi:DNA recombination-dependent growth factor C